MAKAFTIRVLSKPDDRGRCDLEYEWRGYRVDLEREGPRMQLAFAVPEERAADLKRRGWAVTLLPLDNGT